MNFEQGGQIIEDKNELWTRGSNYRRQEWIWNKGGTADHIIVLCLRKSWRTLLKLNRTLE